MRNGHGMTDAQLVLLDNIRERYDGAREPMRDIFARYDAAREALRDAYARYREGPITPELQREVRETARFATDAWHALVDAMFPGVTLKSDARRKALRAMG